MSSIKVGFVGVGNLGMIMAKKLGLKAGLDLHKMVEAISLSTGNSRALMGVARPMPFPPVPRPSATETPDEKAPTEDLGTKDKRLALEMAETVGAKTPIVQLMEELDLNSTYDAYSTLMIRKWRSAQPS